jgi:hypothetical protein
LSPTRLADLVDVSETWKSKTVTVAVLEVELEEPPE